MPDPAGTRLVVNSFVLNQIAIVILSEQSEDVDEEGLTGQETEAVELIRTIRNYRHVIAITEKLREREYGVASQRYKLLLLLPALQQLQDEELVIEAPTRRIPELRGVPQRHRTFFEEAIRTNSRYFLTRRPEWLDLAPYLEHSHSLSVVSPTEYVRRQRS